MFAPKNYTCGENTFPYRLFIPRNILTLHEIAFADEAAVFYNKDYFEVSTFYCEELHTWFFPPFDTGLHLIFSVVMGGLIKLRSPTEDWLFDEGTTPTGVRRR